VNGIAFGVVAACPAAVAACPAAVATASCPTAVVIVLVPPDDDLLSPDDLHVVRGDKDGVRLLCLLKIRHQPFSSSLESFFSSDRLSVKRA
jgi:hypothetical protein